MDTETTTASPSTPAPLEPASRWEDFLDILYAPAAVFERRRGSGFGWALVAVTVLMAILFYASQGPLEPAFSADFRRAMETSDAPRMTGAQAAAAERMAGTFGLLAVAIGFPIGVLLIGAVLWLVGKAFGSVATYGMAALVATYSQVPRLLQQVAALLQGLLLDDAALDSYWRVSVGPARFFDPDTTSVAMLALLGRFDLFVLWSTVLLAIGLAVVGRISRGEAAVAAAVVWVLGVAPALLGAL